MNSIEHIKNDLENDDIFTIAYRGEHQGRGLSHRPKGSDSDNFDPLDDYQQA